MQSQKKSASNGADPESARPVEAEFRRLQDDSTSAALGLAAPVLTVLYLLFAVSHPLVLGARIATILSPLAALTAAWMGWMWILLRKEARPRAPHMRAGLMALAVLVNSAVTLWVTRDPLQTTNLILLVVSVGIVLSSTPWFVGMVATCVLVWSPVAFVGDPRLSPSAVHFGFGFLSAAGIGSILFVGKRRLLRHLAVAQVEERRQSEELAWSENRYRELFEKSPGMLCLHDAHGVLLAVNEAGAEALGYDQDALIGRNLGDFIEDSAGVPPLEYLHRVTQSGHAEGTVRIRTAGGEVRLWSFRNTVFGLDSGELRVVGSATDVTDATRAQIALEDAKEQLERRVAERTRELEDANRHLAQELEMRAATARELRHLGEQYAAILDAFPDLTMLVDGAGNIRSFHAGPHHDVIPVPNDPESATVRDVFSMDVARRIEECVTRTLAAGASEELEFRVHEHGWTYHFEARFVRGGEDEVVVLVRNVSDRVRAQSEKESLQAQLRQSQKLEALGLLAGGIAHDFNNILMSILGFAELSQDGLPEDSGLRESMEYIISGALRGRDLIQQILVFSRAESRPMMAVDIPLALEEAARFLRASLPASITIEVDTAPDSGTVLGDATQIQQVLINLGTNAGHAMKDGGGRLALRCAPGVFRGGDDGEESPAVVIQVEDTGVGMTQDTLERLFDPFFSTKPSGEGTGLGLSVVHGIVSGHGGHINVSSQLGDGTTVTVVLPQGITEVVADVVPDEEVNREDGSGRIMIVDDEEFIVELLSTHLTDLGYQSIVFNSPVQALEFAREDPVDLLLTDFAMPGMTGLDLAERLREAAPRLPVILMTGYGADLHPDRIHALGVHRVLHKPFRLPTLAAAVRQALGDAGGE